MKRATTLEVNGSSLKGYITLSYDKLVKAFGKPSKGDKWKVDAEWRLKFPDGTIATIYNYKDGKSYLGKEGLPVERITNWHIGGFTNKAVDLIYKHLGIKTKTPRGMKRGHSMHRKSKYPEPETLLYR